MNDLTNFEGQEEVQVTSRPAVKQFKKGDVFVGYLKQIFDEPKDGSEEKTMGGKDFGTKTFQLVAIGDKNKDHKSEDGTATGEATKNEITEGEEYNFYTNYTGVGKLNVNGIKMSQLPLGNIVKIENLGKKKSEKSSYFYKDQSIIGKKEKDEFVIHPDYKAPEDFSGQDDDENF